MKIQITEKDFLGKYYSYIENLIKGEISSITISMPEEKKTLKVSIK